MDTVGFIGGLCTSGAALPQIWHLVKTKSAKDFSWHMLGISSFGQCLWITHGALQKDPAVLTFASFNLVMNAIFSVIKISTNPELQMASPWWVKYLTVPALVPFERLPDEEQPTSPELPLSVPRPLSPPPYPATITTA